MPVTIKDIAKKAGVSHQAVSAVVNNNFKNVRVGKEKQKKILALAEKLRYVPSGTARSLVSKKTKIIAVLFPYDLTRKETLNFYGYNSNIQFITGFQETIQQQDFRLKLISYDMAMQNLMADGLLVMYWGHYSDPMVRKLQEMKLPFVVAFRHCTFLDVPNVYLESKGAMYRLTKHLIDLGHKKIAYAGAYVGDLLHWFGRIGVQKALKESGIRNPLCLELPILEEIEDRDERLIEMGKRAMSGILDSPDKPTAVIFNHDALAFGAMQEARNQGIRVPDDLSVTGYGDTFLSRIGEPQLTTIGDRSFEAGQKSGEMLLNLINKKSISPKKVRIPLEPVFRGSVKKIN